MAAAIALDSNTMDRKSLFVWQQQLPWTQTQWIGSLYLYGRMNVSPVTFLLLIKVLSENTVQLSISDFPLKNLE